ncbi:MAG: ABC transporter ATP-binding protein [Candidatus Fimadaptatus sp.]|nr:ABC transporter ATP-binding protein [Candidatus Fimadaptatus sp.]
MENVLSVRGLTKRYDKFALKDVSFDVRRGEIMGFIGRNGAGKTTTLKSLMNYLHPDAGEIDFFGKPMTGNEMEIKRRTGFVTGGVDYYMRRKLRAITDVTRGFYPNWDEAAYKRCIAAFSLDEDKTPAELSAGMKVKYNLALAMSHRAELLLLDEPTSGLDPVSRDDLLDVFLGLKREGVSILFSTHITSDLDKCADRITYIRAGEIQACCALEELVNAYVVAEIPEDAIGGIPANLLIGAKPARRGFSALVRKSDAAKLNVATTPAALDDVIVHMEKEAQ